MKLKIKVIPEQWKKRNIKPKNKSWIIIMSEMKPLKILWKKVKNNPENNCE